jgi:radical SAM superfamily enzyme YgiQ (UPF0313 family)
VNTIVDELKQLHELCVTDVSLYDDALLFRSKEFFLPLMERIHSEGLRFRFHTPNGLSARMLDEETTRCLRDSGFASIHIGFETSDPVRQTNTGGKVTNDDLERALSNLEQSGYPRKEIVVYLLMGLPDQPPEEVKESLRHVNRAGARAMLAEFSPVPGTVDGDRARGLVLLEDPLLENSTVFPLLHYGRETVNRLKSLAQEFNQRLQES